MADSRARLFNTLTFVMLALTLFVCAGYALIFVAAPAPASVAAQITPTPSPTDTPTTTPTSTRTPRLTNTPTHTATPSPTPTETPVSAVTLTGSETPTFTPTPGPSLTPSPTRSPFNYVASVEYQRSIYGLNWAGIAGLIFGLDRRHQTNIVVRAWGAPPLGADGVETASGIAPQYGLSGFEFTVGDGPVTGQWNVQLLADDGSPLSDVIRIELYSDPRFNLAYIIFEQNH